MRIAVMVISLCLTMVVGLQSCTVMVGGGLAENETISGAGAAGVLLAFLFVLGGAFALGLPRLSLACFGIAAVIGLLVGSTTEFRDLAIWGALAAALAVMAYFGHRELRQKKVKADNPPSGATGQESSRGDTA